MRQSDIERGGPSPGRGPTKKEHVAWRKPEPAAGFLERTARSHQHLTLVGIDQPECGLGRCVGDSPVVTSAARHENDNVLAIELLGHKPPELAQLEIPSSDRKFDELDLNLELFADEPQGAFQEEAQAGRTNAIGDDRHRFLEPLHLDMASEVTKEA